MEYERNKETYSIKLNVVDIRDGGDASVHYTISHQGENINIRIGDADRTVTGRQTYKIHYTVQRAVNYFNNAPEVYWNATGNEWPYEMRQVTAHFHSPDGVSNDQLHTACYVGPPGSQNPGEIDSKNPGEIVFSAPGLPSGQNLTFVVGLPAGSVTKAGLIQELLWWLADWWPAFVFPMVAAGGMWMLWMHAGRDQGAGGAIAVEWSPPKGLSPAEVGTLVDESCDVPDIVSTVVDLAARGYFTIREIKSEKLLFMSTRDYEFTKNDPPPKADKLDEHEAIFLAGLFNHRTKSVRLSDLKYTFYPTVNLVRNMVYNQMVTKHFFTVRPDKVRGTYFTVGVVVIIVGVVMLWLGFDMGHVSWGLGAILAGVIVASLAKVMPAKTVTGTEAMRECLGFKRFMALVEKDRIARMAKEDPTIFGRLLPFAMVLGVADQWAHAFDGLMIPPPDWYRSSDGMNTFNTVYFANHLGAGMGSMSQTMTSTPPSSSSSGGGGGSSGFSGGFSGGGFGGGGGGSW